MQNKKMSNQPFGKGNTKLNTALYIRLSRDDGDKTESLSIANQRLLLKEFINKQDDLCLYDEYVDDGFSGTNFDRPDFQRPVLESKVACEAGRNHGSEVFTKKDIYL